MDKQNKKIRQQINNNNDKNKERKTVILYTKGRVGYLAIVSFRWNRLRDSRNHSANAIFDSLYIRPYIVKYVRM